jgi:hypothetical protein
VVKHYLLVLTKVIEVLLPIVMVTILEWVKIYFRTCGLQATAALLEQSSKQLGRWIIASQGQ